MKALVINLKSSAKRMQFQEEQLAAQEIEFLRIEATDVKNLTEEEYQKNAFHWQRPLRESEVACCLSHKQAWETVKEINHPCLILEDDALLSGETKTIIQALNKSNDFDCVSLETRKRIKCVDKEKTSLCEGFKISKLIQDKCGAAAYVLWPSGADILLNWISKNGIGLADALIAGGPNWRHGQIEPAAAIQLDCCEHYGIEQPMMTESNIDAYEKPKMKNRFPYQRRRVLGQIKVALRKILHCRNAEYVALSPHADMRRPKN